jgi:hypothetical protein
VANGGQQCEFTKPDGTRCKARPLSGSSRCYFHSEQTAKARTEARRKGGRTRCKPAAVLGADAPDVRLDSVGDVLQLLGQTVSQLRRGELDPRVANATGYLLSIGLRAIEGDSLAKELEQLRGELEALKQHGHGNLAQAGGEDPGGDRPAYGGGEPDPGGDPPGPGGRPDGGGVAAGRLAAGGADVLLSEDVAPLFPAGR